MANGKQQRVDPDFAKEMREIMKIRLDRGLIKFDFRELGTRKATSLLRKCENYPKCLEELKTKPEKRT